MSVKRQQQQSQSPPSPILSTSHSQLMIGNSGENHLLDHHNHQMNSPNLIERAKKRIVFSSAPSPQASSAAMMNFMNSSCTNNNSISPGTSRNMKLLLSGGKKQISEDAQILELQKQQRDYQEQKQKHENRNKKSRKQGVMLFGNNHDNNCDENNDNDEDDDGEGKFFAQSPTSPRKNNNNNDANSVLLSSLPTATLQEKILSAKVAELSAALQKATSDKEGLQRSLRTAIHQNEQTKSKLDAVSDLLAATAQENKEYEKFFQQIQQHNRQQQQQHAPNLSSPSTNPPNENIHHHQIHDLSDSNTTAPSPSSSPASLISLILAMKPKTSDAATQAPDIPDAAAFDAEIERQTLYSSKDVRAALMSLLDRHDDVKELLLRNSWLRRNQDFCEKFPSFVQPIRPVAIEMVDGRRPPTAETLLNANETPRSILHSEMSELTRRAHPGTRHRTLSQKQKFNDQERDKRTGGYHGTRNEVISWQEQQQQQQLQSPNGNNFFSNSTRRHHNNNNNSLDDDASTGRMMMTASPPTSSRPPTHQSSHQQSKLHFSPPSAVANTRPNTAGQSMFGSACSSPPGTRPSSRK